MLTLPPSVRIYLASALVDMRRGHDGLSALVRNHWDVDIYGATCSCSLGDGPTAARFCFGDRGGFVLYYKRLERGRFRLPQIPAGASSVAMDATELAMLLDGIDVGKCADPPVGRRPHQTRQPPREVFPGSFRSLARSASKGDRQIHQGMIKHGRWYLVPRTTTCGWKQTGS